jgi:hypothetical protein
MESDIVELGWDEAARQMNDCEYLLARSIREIEELTLEVFITEAKAQAEILVPRDSTQFEQLRVGSRPIEPDSTCRIFRLIFERRHMVSYTVLNESYGIYPKPPEQFTGKLFRTFSRSHLLDFTKQTTCASDEYPGGILQHYQIVCLNHVIDVICTAPPKITSRRNDGSGARTGRLN